MISDGDRALNQNAEELFDFLKENQPFHLTTVKIWTKFLFCRTGEMKLGSSVLGQSEQQDWKLCWLNFYYYRWLIKQQLHTVVLKKHRKGKFNKETVFFIIFHFLHWLTFSEHMGLVSLAIVRPELVLFSHVVSQHSSYIGLFICRDFTPHPLLFFPLLYVISSTSFTAAFVTSSL